SNKDTFECGKGIPGLFDKIKSTELTPLQQQTKSWSDSITDARIELKLLGEGANDNAIRVAQQFNLMSKAKRDELAGILTTIGARRQERQDIESAAAKIQELSKRYSILKQKTVEGKLAYELFGLSLKELSPVQKEMVDDAANWQRGLDKATEAEKRNKAVKDELARTMQEVKTAMFDLRKEQSLSIDVSIANQIAWDRFKKSFEQLSPATKKIVNDLANLKNAAVDLARAQADIDEPLQAQAEMFERLSNRYLAADKELLKLKDTTQQGAIAAEEYGEAFENLDPEIQAFIMKVANAEKAVLDQKAAVEIGKQAIKNWADAMVDIADKQHSLREELDLLNNSSRENKISWELFGTAIENLDNATIEWVLHLADLQKKIDDTTKKQDGFKDLANDLEGVFMGAFRRLDEGFGGFIDGIIEGFDRMLQEMAFKYLSSVIVKAIMGGLGADISAYADGGNFMGGDTMLVGERGPEIVKFNRGGMVVPNNQIAAASSGPTNVYMTVVT
ncbi:MAG: hypothetical protein ACRD2L_21805, partial [Terriglobia bacterium]